MLLSWLYELTPEGIVRTEDLDSVETRSVQRASGRILDFIIIGVLLLVIVMMIVGRRPFYRQTGESISQKSIAVLPFENRSEDKANAYFADGIQDEILTLLSGSFIDRREGNWDQSIAYFEQAFAFDPRNMESLTHAAETYAMLRQFPSALKLYDRVLDIAPNDPDAMASKAGIYQAQGNLQEAAKLLKKENRGEDSGAKLIQLRLQRNHGETVRLVQDQLARSHYDSQVNKAGVQAWLALMQRLAGDTAGAKVTAEQARNTLEQSHGDQPDIQYLGLSEAYAVTGQKDWP